MKIKKLLLILFATVLISSAATFNIHSLYRYYEVREIDMALEVAPKLGMNTDTDMLNFGANYPGNSCKRFVDISFPEEAEVVIKFEGQLAHWVSVDDNNFILDADENKHLSFLTSIPSDADEGNYTGKVKFYFKRI